MSPKTSRQAAALVVAAALIAGSLPALAHHSLANYDRQHEVTLTGTVVEFQLKNPHSQIVFEVTEPDGTVTRWTAGTSSPMRLYRMGWKTTTLKPGDRITVTGGRHRGEKREIWLNKLMGPNGNEPPVPQGAE
jgi:chitodextrinase